MKKKTILILWIVGFVIALIGTGLFVPSIVAAANHCTIDQFGGKSCALPPTDPLTYVGLIGVVALIIGGLLHFISWIGALVRSARTSAWLWFVITLIFSSLGTLIYAIVTPSETSYEVPAPH
ncbi:MAG TPA: hypothetical protein VGM01_00535 [Ktedonobacteraceae bacterium]